MQKMIEETRKAKVLNSVWLECLIFALLFFIAQILQSIILIVPQIKVMYDTGFFSKITEPGTNIFELSQEIASSPDLFVYSLFSTVMMIATVIFYCKVFQKRSLASLGIVKSNLIKNYLIGAILGLAFSSAVYGVLYITGSVDKFEVNGLGIIILVFLIGFIIQSAAEEILTRGYLMNALAAKSNIPVAIIINSFIFMALHLLNPGVTFISMFNILLYGVIFSFICLLSDDIWMASGMHFSWNFALGCIWGGNVSGLTTKSLFTVTLKGSNILSGGKFGIEGSIVTTVIGTMIAAVLGYMWYKRSKKETA